LTLILEFTDLSAPLNVAVVGCGMLARSQHIPNIVRSAKMRLHTCCDVSLETLALCNDEFKPLHVSSHWEAVIANPEVDLVVLATTERMRLPVIKLCADFGKPVYVEKPLATTLEEAYQIQAIVNASKIPFCIGHNRRAAPAMIDAYRTFRQHMESPKPSAWRFDREGHNRPKLPDDGAACMSVRINDDWYSWKGWVFDKQQAPEGPMLFEMTHFTDICNWFLASKPVEVMAMKTGMLNHGVIIRYETGEIATITMGSNGSFAYPKELYEVMGKGAVVVVDHMVEVRTAGIGDPNTITRYPLVSDRHPQHGTEGGLSGWLAKKKAACIEAEQAKDAMLSFTAEPDKGHNHALDMFVDQIRGTGPVVCDVDSAVLATRVAFAAIKSANEHRAVMMQEI
jgi:predicted dehydrogenase